MKSWSFIAVSLFVAPACSGVVVDIPASKDATLYESATGHLANGAGDFFFAGRTLQGSGSLRRGLIEFDIASFVPAGATINSASLRLQPSLSRAASTVISLHRLTREWTQGLTDAPGAEGGGGSPVAGNDATWQHATSPGVPWTGQGAAGDFNAVASSSQLITVLNTPYTWTGLGSDVQAWLNNDNDNHGWLILGDESTQATAVQFASLSNFDDDARPLLRIDFTPVPEPPSVAAAILALLPSFRRRRVQSLTLSIQSQ